MLKHSDNLDNKEKIKYDLYKILRMSVLLSQNEVDQLTLSKFKDAALNIDKLLSEEYDEKLENMFYDTSTLEDEERRLKDLVAFINERIESRKNLLEDYRNVTSKELTDLEYIDKSGDLDLYKERLEIIKEYLDSSKLIEVNEEDLIKLKELLVKEYDLKASNEIRNEKIEEELYNSFVNVLYEMDLYSSLDLDNVDGEIEKLQKEIEETKEQMDTFVTAFNNLKLSGISGDLELEYASYVENSRKNYYYVKEKEVILNLYKLIEIREKEYSDLYNKREEVKDLLQERTLLRTELNIKEQDYLVKVSNLIFEQKQEIENEKENIDNINVLTERIKLKESRIDNLKKIIKKPEILTILKEYSLIDTYDHEDIIEENEVEDETLEENESVEDNSINLLNELLLDDEASDNEELEVEIIEEKEILPNQIVESLMVPSMNFGLSRLKSISVMKRVADMLGINAKKEEVKEEVIEVSPIEEVSEVEEEKDDALEVPQEELFWTPVEFQDMKEETEEETVSQEPNIPELFIPNVPMFEDVEEKNEEEPVKEEDIFAISDNNMLFPEPVMPVIEQKELPEDNKEDKFMWPDNMETFDLNGIFPN